MKNKLSTFVLFAGVLSASSTSFATDNQNKDSIPNVSNTPKVSIKGSFDYAYTDFSRSDEFANICNFSNGTCDTNSRAARNGIYGDNSISFLADGKTTSGINYGGAVQFQANISKTASGGQNVAKKAYIYIEDESRGRFEIGSVNGVISERKASPNSIGVATGGIDGVWSDLFDTKSIDTYIDGTTTRYIDSSDSYITSAALPATSHDGCGSKANKINYYSPEFNGFTFNASYTPDASIKGTVYELKNHNKRQSAGFKNVFATTITYTQDFTGFSVKTSASGEIGTTKNLKNSGTGLVADNSSPDVARRHGLKAYALGLEVKKSGFAAAVEYANFGNSGTVIDRSATPSNKYGASYVSYGVAYNLDDYGFSATYLDAKKAGAVYKYGLENAGNYTASNNGEVDYNKSKILALGMEYRWTKGIKFYTEYLNMKFKGGKQETQTQKRKGYKGDAVIIGTKVSF